MTYQIIQGNNIDVLKTYPDNYFDSVVTDPPYGIDFLGKDWDSNTGSLETYTECLRVLKPGGHLLAFSAARTYHHLAVTIERAGFEIRDQIMWIYSSGFPKSQDVGKSIERSEGKRKSLQSGTVWHNQKITDMKKTNHCNQCNKHITLGIGFNCSQDNCEIRESKKPADNEWAGWGTNLKPAHEPICMARKPCIGSIINNVQTYGTGAINIDATRIEGLTDKELNWTPQRQQATDNTAVGTFGASGLIGQEISMYNDKGRFPSNVVGEIEGYQKFFYCPKVNRQERHSGFDLTEIPTNPDGLLKVGTGGQHYNNRKGNAGNNHPTVKPVELMKYLIKLVTPKGGTVLDPYNGSGSTGMAAVELGYNYVGIELDNNYVNISKTRIDAHDKKHNINSELFVVEQ